MTATEFLLQLADQLGMALLEVAELRIGNPNDNAALVSVLQLLKTKEDQSIRITMTYLSADEVQLVDLMLQVFRSGQVAEVRGNGALELGRFAVWLNQLLESHS